MIEHPIVEVSGLSKRFGNLAVIDNLSFSLAPGEALGVVGPNGAGKTTTLNLISGDLRPTMGSVRFAGENVTQLGSNRRCRLGVGRTSQVPRPFEGLSAFENVLVGASFGGRLRRTDAIDASVRALERAGMLDRANVRAGELTLLQRKRLELARALATGPSVLLLDEIAGGLTEAEVGELVETVKSIHRDGVSIIWIEHIVHALIAAVDRLVVLHGGALIAEGAPAEVIRRPQVAEIYMGREADA